MKALAEFSKTTLIGGILIVLPIYVCLLLLAKAAKGLLALLSPITAWIPASVAFREILAAPRARRRLFRCGGDRAYRAGATCKNAFERAVLERLPGYALLRGLAARFTGQADGPHLRRRCRNRGGAGTGADHRGAGGRVLYGAGALGTDADGRTAVHSAARAGASGRCAADHGAEGVLEVGHRRRRVRARDAAE